jgi:hypothetical protein
VTLAVTRNTIPGRVFRRHRGKEFEGHRVPLTGSRCDTRLVSYSGKTPTFCVFPYLALRLWKSVVTLAVTGNTISGRVSFNLTGCRMFKGHRVPLTGSRWDIRLVSYSGKTPTCLYFLVFSVAVMEKCCDACDDEEYYFRSGFSKLQGENVSGASSAVDRKSRGHTVGELQWKDPD